jgi:hypothetical protein
VTERSGLTFTEHDTVATDGVDFVDCRFEGTTLVYDGGDYPRFHRCAFSKASWTFTGAALRTIGVLRAINSSPGGDLFVSDLLKPEPLDTQPAAKF